MAAAEKSPTPHSAPNFPQGAPSPYTQQETKTNGSPPALGSDKGEKDRAKRERKKERKHQEKVEREANKDGPEPASGKATPLGDLPEVDIGSPPAVAALGSDHAPPNLPTSVSADPREDGALSPTNDSSGGRTPTSRRGQRNPWTIFMRMSISANEQDIREFFGEAKDGVRLIR